MQTTLLSFAFAIILALIVALVGPFLVDWNQFRPVLEAEASRMIGLPVRVTGAIDARVLPSPSLTLQGLRIGSRDDERALHVRGMNVEFALGSLLRGELRAVEAQLVGPEITIGLNQAGNLDLPKLPAGFNPDALSVDRLNIDGGRVHLVDSVNGNRVTLDKFWFNGDLRSLAGPLKGEGAFVAAGELFGYRIAAGRLGEDGSLRLRVSLDPSDRPLTAEADGALVIGQGEPRFEGVFNISRPAGLVAATGQGDLKLPWRATSRVRIGPADAKFRQIDFHYGSEESGLRLTGTANLLFGRKMQFKGVFSSTQLDVDRLIATREMPVRRPVDAIKALVGKFGDTLQLPIPTELSISFDTVTLGGAPVNNFGGDLRLLPDGGWSLGRVEFRAPGLTQVNLTGRLDLMPALKFEGPIRLDTKEPSGLAAWLDGRGNQTAPIKPIKARGDLVLSREQVAIESLAAEVDGKPVKGRLRYAWATAKEPSRLDADLSAPELDLDSLLALGNAVRSGAFVTPPSLIALGLDIGRARIAGVEAERVRASLKRDTGELKVERLSVADLGGASLVAHGRIDTSGASPRGNLALNLQARDLDGVIAVLAKFVPDAADTLRQAVTHVRSAKLQASVALDGPAQPADGADTSVRFKLDGQLGGLRASLRGQASRASTDIAAQGFAALATGEMRLEGQIDGDDGRALMALFGWDKTIVVDHHPGFIKLAATGRPDRDMHVTARIESGRLDGKVAGTVRVVGEDGPRADLQLDIAHADIRPLRGDAPSSARLPLTLHGRLIATDKRASLDNFTATLAGTALRGKLAFHWGAPAKVSGQVEADTLDGGALVAAVIGTRAQAGRDAWSSEPYAPGLPVNLVGAVDVSVMRAALTSTLPARGIRAKLVFAQSQLRLEEFDAHVAGGRLAGRVGVRRNAQGIATDAQLTFAGLDAAALLQSEARPALGGRLSGKLTLAAAGLSPKALIGSLAGSATVRLEDAYFSSLDPRVFDTVVRASDQGLVKDAPRIREIVAAALDSGRLRLPVFDTTMAINAGQARFAKATATAADADLSASGAFDLIQNDMDVRLALIGPVRNDGSAGRPEIFVGLKGPMQRPARSIDVSALAGWLTIRSIDRQAKKLEALEAARGAAQAKPPVAAPAQTPPIASSAQTPMSVPSWLPPAAAPLNPRRAIAPSGVLPPIIARPPVMPARPGTATPQPVAPQSNQGSEVPAASTPAAPVPKPATEPTKTSDAPVSRPTSEAPLASTSALRDRNVPDRAAALPAMQALPSIVATPTAAIRDMSKPVQPEASVSTTLPPEAPPAAVATSQMELAPPLPEPVEIRRAPDARDVIGGPPVPLRPGIGPRDPPAPQIQ